jgi:hypothetical protein
MGDKDEGQIIAIPIGSGMGGGMSVPQMAPQGKAEILDKIKPEAMVEIIRHRLLGEEYTNNRWVEVPALKKNKLTEQGAWEIANLMLGVSSINISISKLTDREIKERAFRIAKTAQYLLITNWKEYGITNTSQFRYVHEILFSNTLAVLKQADEASIQELLKVIVYENRNVSSVPKAEKSGKISRMLGFSE